MTLKTLLLTGASAALLSACSTSAPNEYNTYEVNKAPSSYQTKHKENWTWEEWKFWEDAEDMDNDDEETTSAPISITVPSGRT